MAFDVVHGIRVDDPFRWLEDRQSPRTDAWLTQQIVQARAYLDALPGHDELYADAWRLLSAEVVEALCLGREATFFLRRAPGEDQASLWMDTPGQPGRRLVDVQEIDPSGRTSLEVLAVSRNERILALAMRSGGRNEYGVAFVDLASRQILPDRLPSAEYRGVIPHPDGSGVYYATPHRGTWRIAWRAFGRKTKQTEETAEDQTVFAPGGTGPLKLGLSLSQDARYLLVLTARRGPPRKMDLHALPLADLGTSRLLLGDTDAFCGAVTVNGELYVLTHDNASHRKVIRIALDAAADVGAAENDEDARTVVSESEAVLRGMARTRDRLLLLASVDGLDEIRVLDWNGRLLHTLTQPESSKVVHLATHPQRQDFFFAVDSWQQPRTIVRYDPGAAGGATIWWRRAAPIDAETLTLERCTYVARDGERIPISLVRARGSAAAPAPTPTPTLLLAYGGYGSTLIPALSLRAALWLSGGGQLAVAGIRGGGEHGRRWHDAGAREQRQTAIDDLLDAADWLIADGRSSARQLALAGASHAGTLVAAAMTQRPDRFAAVICTMALLDLVRFESSAYGRWSAQEVGTIADAAQFRALFAYSPYHRVRNDVAYPAVLFVSGDEDTLIDPFHVRKMTARLQQTTSAGRPVLLSYDERRGHRGQLPLAARAQTLADQIAFLRTHTAATGTTDMGIRP